MSERSPPRYSTKSVKKQLWKTNRMKHQRHAADAVAPRVYALDDECLCSRTQSHQLRIELMSVASQRTS